MNNMASNYLLAANLFTASPPSGLQAVAGNAQVALSWNVALGASSYNLKRATMSGGPYTTIITQAATNYIDSNVTNGTAYYYVVSSVRSGGQSANSSQVSATPQLPPPAPPASVAATPGNGQAVLAWTTSSGAATYDVEQSPVSGGPYVTIAATAGNSYTNTGLTNGVTYYYVVASVNTNGAGADSGEVSATPQVSLPATPTGLTATTSYGQIQLSWNVASGASAYYLKRALAGGGPYAIIAEAPQPGWSDLIVTNSVTYYYVVSSVNAAGQSTNSPQVSVTITPALTLVHSASSLVLSWPSWAANYSVYATTNLNPPVAWILLTNTPQSNNGTYYMNLTFTNGGQQFYRLSGP
jgi:cellulose 1,4-beta-cellobiosidase